MGRTRRRKFKSGEFIPCFLGRKHTQESKDKIRNNHTDFWEGHHHNSKTKLKIAKAVKGKTTKDSFFNTYKAISPSNKIYIIRDGLEKFCGKMNLTYSCVRKVVSGRRGHHKKWVIKLITSNNSGKESRKNNIEIIDPLGNIYKTNNLSGFCRQHELTRSLMFQILGGKRKYHKNWTCSRL